MSYHVCTHDWPTTPSLRPEQVLRVLAEFDRYHAVAVRSLAEIPVPDHALGYDLALIPREDAV